MQGAVAVPGFFHHPQSGGLLVAVSLFASLWLLMFVLSRVHMLHLSFTTLKQQREDESWLLGQCTTDEFYHNMKQHLSLCDDLAVTSRSSLLLNAVQHVIDNTFLCGYTPCHVLLDATLAWLLGKGLVVTALLALAVLLFPTLFVLIVRSNMNFLADRRMHQLYNAPYGTNHYGASHLWSPDDQERFNKVTVL